jgi:ATP adenylyltransferase
VSGPEHERQRQVGVGEPDRLERIWTPHRMEYIQAAVETPEGGCPFCTIPDLGEDGLVVARSELAYAVLNLHPYNPGHLMVVPFRHVADLEDLTKAESDAVTAMTQEAVRTMRRVSNPDAFNIGLNLGRVSGGSLAAHLHQHVVPRWAGDANFITVTAGTKTLPQLLADTRALLAGAWDQTTA